MHLIDFLAQWFHISKSDMCSLKYLSNSKKYN